MLRRRDGSQGGEAASVVRLTPVAARPRRTVVSGHPLARTDTGALDVGAPVRIEIDGDRILRVDAASDGGATGILAPALSDSHIHLFAAATAKTRLDLSADPPLTIEALLARVRAHAGTRGPGSWLRVRGHDESRLAERRQPTAVELDIASAGRPVRMRHATLHASVLSSSALERLPEALRRLGRDGDGLIVGHEEELSRECGPQDDEELTRGLAELGAELLADGIACVDDTTATNDATRVARLAAAVRDGSIPQRVRVWLRDADELTSAREAAQGDLEIAGVKLLPTRVEEARERDFQEAVARARRRGLAIAIHAVDPDVIDAALDALLEAPPRAEPGVGPDRLEHCSLCPPLLAERIAAARVAVVTQPGFLVSRGAKYRREVEEPLWPWLYPIRTLRAAGALVAGSSDAPVIRPDPRLGFRGATTRSGVDGTVFGAGEALPDADALDLYTTSAARLRGEGDEWLRAGARADLVLLGSGTPDLEVWRPRKTIVGGELHEGFGGE